MKKVILVFMLLTLSGCSSGRKEPEVIINAADLSQAYKDNEVSASLDYDDKFVEVTGIIRSVSGDKDEVVISFYSGVICIVTSNIEDTRDIKQYNKVTIQGTISGLLDYGVGVHDCSIEKTLTETSLFLTAQEFDELDLEQNVNKIVEITGVVRYEPFANVIHLDTDIYNVSITCDYSLDISGINKNDNITVKGIIYQESIFNFIFYSFVAYEIVD